MSPDPNRDPHVLLQWQKHQSAHFVFWFLEGSQVENHVTAYASSLEAVRDATAKALDFEDLPHEQVQVYLSDTPGYGRSEGSSQVWELGGKQVLVVYLSDAPGEALEHAFMELLLTSSLGISAERSAMLIDGMLGYVAQRTGDSDSHKLNAALVRIQSEGRQISLGDVLRGPTIEAKLLYQQVVTSFVTFLLTTYGPEPFKRFAQEFDPDAPDRASEAAYGKTMATLEEEWLVTLQQEQASVLGALEQSQASARGIAGVLRFALSYMRPYWKQEVLILLAVLLTSIFTVILPLAFGRVIEDLISEDYSEIKLILAVVAGLFILQSPALVGKEYLTARVGAKITNDIRLEMYEHLQRLSANFYSRNLPGDIASRFYGDLLLIYQALTATLPMLLSFAVVFTIGFITVFVLQWKLALLVALALPFVYMLPKWLGSRASRFTLKQQMDFGRVANTLQESVGAQQLVKAYNLQGLMFGRFRAQLDDLGQSMTRGAFSAVLPGISADLIIDVIDVLALIVGTYLVLQGTFSVGDLATFQLLIGAVIGPTTSLTGVTQILVLASAGVHRVEQLLNEQPQIVDAPDARPLERFSREIRFEKVNFSYTGEQVNLRDLNLTILAGQSVAFVGPSGSGKSTILNLLMRFYDPTTGAVTIDGQDLRQVTQQSLRSQVGVLFQETFLYNTTVRENITQGKPDATDREVEAAAKAAEIHDFILGLPHGYDTPVGERGGQLSGGQRQRIALARAILYDPQVLLLDEPTSALDPQTEAAINATLRKLGQGRTVITVTHRLKSVENADRIVVLERGRVVEQGTHQELLDAGGLYRRLWGQQNGFEPAAAAGRRRGVEASRLRTIPLFGNLDGDLLLALADSFVVERHDEGHILYEEGDPGDKLYFIDRGEVEVVATGPSGEERRAALLRDGDYFGEVALLRDGPRTATVRTRAPSVLLSLDRKPFLDLLQALPDLGTAFERGLEAREVNLATVRGS